MRPSRIFIGIASTDVTAPVLTLPTATSTGSTTADGTVTTDTLEGKLYYMAVLNTDPDPTVAAVIANNEFITVS